MKRILLVLAGLIGSSVPAAAQVHRLPLTLIGQTISPSTITAGSGTTITTVTSGGNLQLVTGSTITTNGTVCFSTAPNAQSASPCAEFINRNGQITFAQPLSTGSLRSSGLSGTFANTTLGPCMANSTVPVTITTNTVGGVYQIAGGFSGTASNTNLAAVLQAGILLDGNFVNGESATIGLVAPLEPVTTDGTVMSFPFFLTGLSPGFHQICLTMATSAGTGTLDSTNSNPNFWAYALP